MTERRASFRIVCDINEEFRVEVLDKTINHWYIVASKMGKGQVATRPPTHIARNTLKMFYSERNGT